MASSLSAMFGGGPKTGSGQATDSCRSLLLDLPAPQPFDIEFFDINLAVSAGRRREGKKKILQGVSGNFRSGELTAVMGPSGAGKTSLLNTLTGFSTKGVTGMVRVGDSKCTFNNNSRSIRGYQKKTCYILQDNQLNPLFTVIEIMKIAANLKLGNSITDKIKQTVVMEVLDTLGLIGTEDTRCGMLSGGQRKRLSIALELIDNPPVVFLDEPTTGLDSVASTQCIELLKTLARGGRTVVCTVHQPTATVYALFDQVYVLADGLCIFNGSSDNTVSYLASVGLQCPKYHNPADYLLEVANGEYGKFNDQLSRTNKQFDWTKKVLLVPDNQIKSESYMSGKTTILITPPSEYYKFLVLLRRCAVQQYRDWTVTHLKVILHIFIGVILGLLFQQAGNDGSKTISNFGYLFITVSYLCYTSLIPAVLRFPQELPVLKKENFNNWYNLKTYYAAVLVTSIPIQILYSVVYCGTSYFISGQPMELYRFLMFVTACAFVTLIADSIGNVIGTCVNAINGTFLGAILTCAFLAYAGFLVMFAHMNQFMYAVSYGSFLRYGIEALFLSVYAYERPPLLCPTDAEYCHYRYPKVFIKEFSLKYENYWFDIGVLCVQFIVFRFTAYFTLRRTVKRS